jgi:DNA processing protein
MERDDWRPWLALRLVRGIGPVVYRDLLRAFGSPGGVLGAGVHALTCAGVRPELARAIRAFDDWPTVDEQLERLARCGARLITWDDSSYPANLRQIHDPPPFLFVLGELQAGDRLAVAIVGSRGVSSYGRRVARELASGLARHGVVVVSGLARGTDAEAHWSALRAGGRTIAVLGSGIDVVYPSEHHALARVIAKQGAIVSELWMGTKPDADNFPARNRIISGLSLGTVIVEATEKSGSLITARFAAEQGREVFAVPGAVGEHTRGTHRLIRDGARLTEGVEDVLEEIAPQLVRAPGGRTQVELSEREKAVLAAVGADAVHIDAVIAGSGIGANDVLPILLNLELKGAVQQLPGMFFVALPVDVRPFRTQV